MFGSLMRKVRGFNARMMRDSERFQRRFAADELARLSGEADRLDARYGAADQSTVDAREREGESSRRLDGLSGTERR